MRFRLTRNKGTLVFGIWVILLGVGQMVPMFKDVPFLGLVAITAGVLILFEL